MNTVICDPRSQIEELAGRLEALERGAKAARKQLKEMGSSLSDLRKLKTRVEALRRLEGPFADVNRALGELADQVEAWRGQEERTRPARFGRDLKEAAEQAQVPFALVTTEPPRYQLDPVTVEISFTKGVARLEYSRIPLGECPLETGRILHERARYLQALEGEQFQPEAYFETLLEAYRRALAGRPTGERVDLVDLLPEIAFQMQGPKFRNDPSKENFRPYGRVRLAYDLTRLRRAGCLAHKNVRLTLGTATIGSTRNKDRVLFLEDIAGKGQFYLSIAFVPEVRR